MDCVIIGDVFFDVVVKANPSNFGLIYGGTSYSNAITLQPGGSGNVAVGLSKLGSKVQFIGKAGNDALGNYYRNDLIGEGVKTMLLFDDTHSTGITITFVDDKGERTFLVSRGANDFLLPEEIDINANDIGNAKCLYVCGFSLINNPQKEAIFRAVTIAKEIGVKVVFDPGASNIILQNERIFQKMLHLCDVFTPNLREAQAITNLNQIEAIAKHFAKTIPLTILKMGPEGCIIINSNEIIISKANSVTCLDSSGAGDAFVSAVIYSMIKNVSIDETGKFANWFASFNVKKFGPRSFPTQKEISKYLSTLKKGMC